MSNCITDENNNMQQGQYGAECSLYCFFLNNFPLFSKIFINIDEYANRIIYLHVRPFHRMKVIYISFNMLANLIE